MTTNLKYQSLQRRKNSAYLKNLFNLRQYPSGKNNSADKKFEHNSQELIKITLKDQFHDFSLKTQLRDTSLVESMDGSNSIIRKESFLDITLYNNPLETHEQCIWKKFEKDYQARSIVFECKNYKKTTKISGEEISQLRFYLKDRGKLGIILCRYIQSIAPEALARIDSYKDDGYRIFIIDNLQIIKWIESYENGTVTSFFADLDND